MSNPLAKCIGDAARQARKALQFTQEDVAERLNVSVEFYARIERGVSLPSVPTFARMVAVLGVSADALLGRQPVTPHPPGVSAQSMAAPRADSPELRRLIRRLRKAGPEAVRLAHLVLREIERATGKPVDSDS